MYQKFFNDDDAKKIVSLSSMRKKGNKIYQPLEGM